MTALVIVESGVNLDDKFTVTREDFVPSSAHSKLRMGMEISAVRLASGFNEFG